MMKDALVSVIVPTYKVEKYLSQCLDSICSQTLREIEIICVYTDSPDSSLAILEKYAQKDARVQIIRRDDGGLGGARNYGMSVAKGEYIACVDSDDWIAVDMLEGMYAVAKKNDADLVICAINSYDDTTRKLIPDDWGYNLPFPHSLAGKSFCYKDIKPSKFISNVAPVAAWNKLYRRGFLDENNIRFPENLRYEDNPFYYETMVRAKRICFTNERYYYYRKNRIGSLQDTSANDKSIFDIIKIFSIIGKMLDENQVPLPVKDAFVRYMIDEFGWRYFSISGNKRRFLQAIRDKHSNEIYNELISVINKKGASANIIEGANAQLVKVSVIIPVYNSVKYLSDCLDSVLSQNLTDIEIICVNDKSTDGSDQVLREYAENDTRIKVFENTENSGAGVCRDKALKTASGEFIFFLDSDDLLPDGHVLMQLYNACLENNMLTCAGNIAHFQNDNRYNLSEYTGVCFAKTSIMSYTEYKVRPTWGFSRFLFNLELIWENNITFQGLRYYEDPYFFVHYMNVAKNFIALNRLVYLYRENVNHHKTLGNKELHDYFTAQHDILNVLKSIDHEMYYNEYVIFLDFCHKIPLVSKNEAVAELIQRSNDIFKKMDFSNYEKYIGKDHVFCSYEALMCGSSEAVISNSPVSGMKKFVKKILKPFIKPLYRVFYNRMVQIVDAGNSQAKEEFKAEISCVVPEISQAKAELKAELKAGVSCVMAEISQAKAELKAEISCVMAEISQKYQLMFLHDYAVTNLIQKKKVFLVGTAEHSNIGDAAIVAGEYEFIKKLYPDHAVIEISTYLFEQQYPLMRATITNDDIIFLHGGGNLGTLYLNEENVRRTVLHDYPNHKTVIFPQTIYFSPDDIGDTELKISSTIYNNHKNLILFTRGMESLQFAKKHFPHVKSVNALDSAHLLNGNFGYDRTGTLLCIRDLNDESGLTEAQYKAVHEIVANEILDYTISNNIYSGDIPKEIRRRVVDDELQLFARHKAIVTDRLHGLIFSVITRTPCVLISAYNQKIAEFADNFSDSNAVFFIDKDLGKLSAALQSALAVSQPHYPALDDAKPFDAMYSLIDGRIR